MWAGPRGGGGGIGDGGHVGGFGGGGSSRGHFGGFAAGGIRAAPAFSGGSARFGGRSVGAVTRTPQQFDYYNGARTSGLTQHAFVRQTPNRSTTQYTGGRGTVTHQQNPTSSIAGRTRISNPRTSTTASRLTAANRQSFIKDHASVRHDPNWHRNWDRYHAHFHNGKVFVFINGFWWGLYPWDYYPYDAYGSYTSEYYGYPYGYNDYSYDSYDYNAQDPYSYYNGYAGTAQSGNGVVGSVQSQLAKRGYYPGAIDGILGDETEAAIARYQEDNDLSVTGTLTAATLQSLGLTQTAG